MYLILIIYLQSNSRHPRVIIIVGGCLSESSSFTTLSRIPAPFIVETLRSTYHNFHAIADFFTRFAHPAADILGGECFWVDVDVEATIFVQFWTAFLADDAQIEGVDLVARQTIADLKIKNKLRLGF